MNRLNHSGDYDLARDVALGWGLVPSPDRDSAVGTSGNDTFVGTGEPDTFDLSQGGHDTVRGLGGTDSVSFGSELDGRDRVSGGAGNDEVVLQGFYTDLTITGSMLKSVELLTLVTGGAYNLTFATDFVMKGSYLHIFNDIGQSYAEVTLDASRVSGTLLFYSGVGTHTVTGGSGNDYFRASGQATDVFDGGDGLNRLSLAGVGEDMVFDLAVKGVQAVGDGTVTVRNIQHLSGGTGADTLSGTEATNWLLGGGGDDHLAGRGGDDLLEVGVTAGIMATHGLVDGGRGIDVVSLFGNGGATGGATVSLLLTGEQDTGQGTYALIEVEGLSGTTFDDTLTGDRSANALYGYNGADHLVGGSGNDELYGDAAFRAMSDFHASGDVGVDPNMRARFADTLDGGNGDDQLFGGGGNDVLIGGAGADTLFGGAERDHFIYMSRNQSRNADPDTIADFTSGDRVDVSAVDADVDTRGDQAFHFGATVARVGDITAAFDAARDVTVVSFFMSGDAKPDMTIHLTGNVALTAADFIL